MSDMQYSSCHKVTTVVGPVSLEQCKTAVHDIGANTLNYIYDVNRDLHGVCEARLCHQDEDLQLQASSDVDYLLYSEVHCQPLQGMRITFWGILPYNTVRVGSDG